jgi:hypothetical protein
METDTRGKWTMQAKQKWKEKNKTFFAKEKGPPLSKTDKNMTIGKKANWHSVLALDMGTAAVWRDGLKAFLPEQKLQPLPAGTVRQFVKTSTLPEWVQRVSSNRLMRRGL